MFEFLASPFFLKNTLDFYFSPIICSILGVNHGTSVDFIVIGQGLAGSAVALHALDLGKRIVVFDEFSSNTSSRIAAGLFNPVTGQNSVRTWLADELFSYLDVFYRRAEHVTGEKFFHPKKLYRPFASVQEQNDWMGRSTDEAYSMFVDELYTSPRLEHVMDPFGGMMLKKCGYLDTKAYIDSVRQLLIGRGIFHEERFDDNALIITPERVEYRGFFASAIIFCQGIRGRENKFFQKLPVRPLKGETITIKTDFRKDVILNRGVYMVPDGAPGLFRVGSTYKLNDLTPGASEQGKQELGQKLMDLLRLQFEIVGADWGVRPTTNDRRPLLGSHPEHERLIIFNGLGTKGVSLAPYFSNVLIRWLDKSGLLPKEVILTRYK